MIANKEPGPTTMVYPNVTGTQNTEVVVVMVFHRTVAVRAFELFQNVDLHK